MANYPTSTITFKATKLKPELNALVDNIDDYLGGITNPVVTPAVYTYSYTVTDFQWIKHGLNISVKIDYRENYAPTIQWNYCTIKNSNEIDTYYYFITSAKPVGNKTIAFELQMDTVNTLPKLSEGSAYGEPYKPQNFLPQTYINRQHGDRFHNLSGITPQGGANLPRRIDKPSEGIVPTKRKTTDTKLNATDNIDWYLVYMTGGASLTPPISDVYIMLLPSEQITARITTGTASADTPLKTIDDLDRTDEKITKILQSPYCPVEYTHPATNIYQFGTQWQILTAGGVTGYLYMTATAMEEFKNIAATAFDISDALVYTLPSDFSKTSEKKYAAESKLWHSDISTYKVIYDSFSRLIQPEFFANPTTVTVPTTNVSIDYKISNTISGKMAFKLNFSGDWDYVSDEDFGEYLICSRNAEALILTDAYIEYLQNGYNYDKKTQALALENAQRSATTTTIGSGLSAAAAIAGLLLGGPTIKAASAIALGTSLASGAISTVNAWENVSQTEESQRNTMAQKFAQLQAQAATASGTDDLDLFNWYSGNRLHKIIYRPDEKILQALYTVFDLTGYACNHAGTPNVTSRIWHNFIQCMPVINQNTRGLTMANNNYEDDFINRYRNGVTVYHMNTIDGVKTWDFNNTYENWETWLFD